MLGILCIYQVNKINVKKTHGFISACKADTFMTHIKWQKLILSTLVRGFKMQSLLCPQPLSWWY